MLWKKQNRVVSLQPQTGGEGEKKALVHTSAIGSIDGLGLPPPRRNELHVWRHYTNVIEKLLWE